VAVARSIQARNREPRGDFPPTALLFVLSFDSYVNGIVVAHGFASLFEVTVYGGFVTITYAAQCFRKHDFNLCSYQR
jgi:hypothetical protein